MGQPIVQLPILAVGWGEIDYGDGSTPLSMTQPYCPASMAAQLSSTTSPQSLCPQSTAALALDCSTIPNSSSQLLCLPGDQHPCTGYVWLQQVLSDSHSFRLPQITVSLSALNVSPLTQTVAPLWGSDRYFSSPTCQGQVQSY